MRIARLIAAGVVVCLAACGGGGGGTGASEPQSNPAPAISSLSPASANMSGPSFTLTVNGTNFISTSQVQWNGSNRSTTYVSASEVTASITAADIAVAGKANVTVVNPAPGGGTSSATVFTTNNPPPTVSSTAPASALAGGAGFTLTVNGTNFLPSSTIQWNGENQTTTFVNATTLTTSIPASAVAVPTAATITVSNPSPGGGTSAGVSLTALWPKPSAGPNGYLVDVPTQAATLADLNAFGNPFFAAWNPTDNASILSPGMKVIMWGSPDPSCPASTQGPMGTFADSSLVNAGYPNSPANVPSNMRFTPLPMASCTAASTGKQGPNLVFGDGSQIWMYVSSLGQSDALLLPWNAAGQNGTGANANLLDAVVTFETPQPWTIKPWVSNGLARIAAMAQVTAITADNVAEVNQVKQELELNFVNTTCLASLPANQCQMEWQFEQVIVQSGVTDWSKVPWAQSPVLFFDPAQGTIPVMAVTLVPGVGQNITDGTTGLSLATSQGTATQHAPIPLTQFDVSMSFNQLANAIRIISAKFLNQPVGTDTACSQCSQVFGASWNDPAAWVVSDVQVEQEDADPSHKSGAVLGGFTWLYVGAAP